MYAYRPGLTTSIVDRCCGRRSHRLSITGHVVYRVGVGLSGVRFNAPPHTDDLLTGAKHPAFSTNHFADTIDNQTLHYYDQD